MNLQELVQTDIIAQIILQRFLSLIQVRRDATSSKSEPYFLFGMYQIFSPQRMTCIVTVPRS